MVSRILLALVALLLPVSAFAQSLEGAWAFRIDDATVFRFELDELDTGGWRGTWTRPETFGSNGVVFQRMEGSESLPSMAGLAIRDGVELSFDDPRPSAIPDIFRFELVSENQALLTYVGTRFEPYPLVRVALGTPLGPFDEARLYDRDNAVTQADYDPDGGLDLSDFPAADDNAEEPDPALAATAADAEEAGEQSRITADFLDDL